MPVGWQVARIVCCCQGGPVDCCQGGTWPQVAAEASENATKCHFGSTWQRTHGNAQPAKRGKVVRQRGALTRRSWQVRPFVKQFRHLDVDGSGRLGRQDIALDQTPNPQAPGWSAQCDGTPVRSSALSSAARLTLVAIFTRQKRLALAQDLWRRGAQTTPTS